MKKSIILPCYPLFGIDFTFKLSLISILICRLYSSTDSKYKIIWSFGNPVKIESKVHLVLFHRQITLISLTSSQSLLPSHLYWAPSCHFHQLLSLFCWNFINTWHIDHSYNGIIQSHLQTFSKHTFHRPFSKCITINNNPITLTYLMLIRIFRIHL